MLYRDVLCSTRCTYWQCRTRFGSRIEEKEGRRRRRGVASIVLFIGESIIIFSI